MNDLLIPVEASDSNQFLTFSVFGKAMAIGIADVREIIESVNITRVPMSNPCVRGVINLRGNVVPVVDLGCRLTGRSIEVNRRSCIVLVEVQSEGESQVMGMLVHEVREILEIEPENTQQTPDFGTEIRTEFIECMGRYIDDFIFVLDLQQLISIQDLSEVPSTGMEIQT